MIPELYTGAPLSVEDLNPDVYMKDAISCIVREELNGVFELELHYPISAPFGNTIMLDDVISAIPSPYREKQPFRIYKISVGSGTDDQVIYARHISYDLSNTILEPFSGTGNVGQGIEGAMSACTGAVVSGFGLTYLDTNIGSNEPMITKKFMTARDAICGPDTSFATVYGAEVEWKDQGAYLWGHRGDTDPKEIPNIGAPSADIDNESYANQVLAYWQGDNGDYAYADVNISDGESYVDHRIMLDCSEDFESKPTKEQLSAAAMQYAEENKDTLSKQKSSVQTEVCKIAKENGIVFDLGDVLHISLPRSNIFGSENVRVVGIETDVLAEVYIGVSLDASAPNIVDTIVSQADRIEKNGEHKTEISTGTLKVYKSASVDGNITSGGMIGFSGAYGDRNVGLFCQWADGSNHYLIVRNSDGLSAAVGWNGSPDYDTKLDLRGRTVRLINSSGTSALSDERMKKDWKGLDGYDAFFDALNPQAFRYIDGASGRYHLGFGAQSVERALADSGLDNTDFGGLIKYAVDLQSEDWRGYDEEYGLIYTEFVALLVDQVKRLKARVSELEGQQASMEQRLAALEKLIGG